MAKLGAVVRQRPFTFTTAPWPHQREALRRAWGRLAFAYLMEMRTGKTKVVIDEAAALMRAGEITALVVVAPRGVHANWAREQWDTHGPRDLACDRVAWTGRNTQTDQRILLAALNSQRPYVFTINYDALVTERGFKYVQGLLAQRSAMLVLDEAHRVKTPSAQRTRAVLKLALLAKFRRILTGTPLANSPLDLYMPFKFLDPRILGHEHFWGFRARYAVLKERHVAFRVFKEVIGYQHLDELRALIAPHAYSVTAAECLGLPARQRVRLAVELSPLQRRHYEALRDELATRLDSGEEMTAALAIVQLTRLQQLLSNWFVPDQGSADDSGASPAQTGRWLSAEPTPRERQLVEYLADVPGKVVIWCRFVPERERLFNLLAKAGLGSGQVIHSAERAGELIRTWQAQSVFRFLIASPEGPAGEGVDLSAADTEVFFSNSFRLTSRVQAEARLEHARKRTPVTVVDLVAAGTVDEHVLERLTAKRELAATFSGAELRRWLH